MSRLSPVAVVAGAVLVAGCAGRGGGAPGGPAPAARTVGGDAITATDLRKRLYEFSDDSMLGREAGTPGDIKATDYIARQAAAIGLQPAGENGTYFQDVPLILRSADPASSFAINGAAATWGRDWLPIASRGGQSPVRPAGAATATAVVFGGRAGDTTVSFTPDQSAGRVVVLDAPLGAGGRPTAAFRGSLDRYPGAAAVVVATLDLMTPAGLEAIQRPLLVPRAAAVTPADTRPLGVSVTQAQASRLMGAPLSSLRAGAVNPIAVSLDVRVRDVEPQSPARNVIAVLPGNDPTLRGEYVALGAHNDHLGVAPRGGVDADSLRAWNTARWRMSDLGSGPAPNAQEMAAVRINLDSLRRMRPPHRDSIYNGADDDGSGTVSVLEIAQALARAPTRPRRSILFVWHTAEEKGLLGSAYFTDHPTVTRDSIVAQLNMDMIGRGAADDWKGGGPRYLLLVGSRRLSTELGDLTEAVNNIEAEPLTFDYTLDANGHPENVYCRSDHYEYARYGIPIVFFTTGLHQDYHQVTDEPQYIDYDHMVRVDRLVFDLALRVANLDHRVVVDKPKPDPHGVCKQ
jgi:hypothetical protein